MRYRLRTLLILMAVGPPFVAAGYWTWQGLTTSTVDCRWPTDDLPHDGGGPVPVEHPLRIIVTGDADYPLSIEVPEN